MNQSRSARNVVRTGSAPKTICYSQTGTQRKFEYQNPYKANAYQELKGNLSKKSDAKPAPEKDANFRKVKVFELPNSQRILDPTLAPEEQIVKPKRNMSAQRNPGSFENLINRTDDEQSITHCRRTPNKKMYKSFVMGEENVDKLQTRKLTKDGEFKFYDNTTQITALPGGIKRNDNQIRDDNRTYEKNNESYNVKLIRDYSSKISCLPTTLKNDEPVKIKTKQQNFSQRELTNNIFTNYNSVQITNTYTSPSVNYNAHSNSTANLLTHNYSNKENTFNVSNKRMENNQKIFGTSNEEKKLVVSSKSKRPEFIRNHFVSQISFS